MLAGRSQCAPFLSFPFSEPLLTPTLVLTFSCHRILSPRIFSPPCTLCAQPLLSVMKAISEERGKTLAQVGGWRGGLHY